MKTVMIVVQVAFFVALHSCACAEVSANSVGKGVMNRPLVTETMSLEDDILRFMATAPVIIYRNVISPVYGSRCRMLPSCSTYSMKAYREHGALLGSILTFDRLLHEGNEYQVSPIVFPDRLLLGPDRAYVYDPIENNTWWWSNKEEGGKHEESH